MENWSHCQVLPWIAKPSLRWSAEAFLKSYPSGRPRLQHVFFTDVSWFALCSIRTVPLTQCSLSELFLHPAFSETLQELTWRTGHTAKCFLQPLAWRTALVCKLAWTQGCHSVPWRLQPTAARPAPWHEKNASAGHLHSAQAVSTVLRLSYQLLPGWDWYTSYYLALH